MNKFYQAERTVTTTAVVCDLQKTFESGYPVMPTGETLPTYVHVQEPLSEMTANLAARDLNSYLGGTAVTAHPLSDGDKSSTVFALPLEIANDPVAAQIVGLHLAEQVLPDYGIPTRRDGAISDLGLALTDAVYDVNRSSAALPIHEFDAVNKVLKQFELTERPLWQ